VPPILHSGMNSGTKYPWIDWRTCVGSLVLVMLIQQGYLMFIVSNHNGVVEMTLKNADCSKTKSLSVSSPSTTTAIQIQTKWIPDDQIKFCQDNNFLNMYQDQPSFRSKNSSRPYSIHSMAFHRHHTRFCESSEELLSAIKFGRRSWGNYDKSNIDIEQKEQLSSYFIPFGCDIPYLTSKQYCDVANMFHHILILGDSQSRHLHQAMLMIYRNDVIQGSIQPAFTGLNVQHRCHCDAQFSPSKNCRPIDMGIFREFRPYQLHTCHHLQIDNQATQAYAVNRNGKQTYNYEAINCSAPDYKGLLLYLQGGVHYKWKASKTFRGIWRKIITHPNIRECAKYRKLIMIWSGYMSQSPVLDRRFQEQSMSKGLIFDSEIEKKLQRFGFSVPTLSWINLTLGSTKTDGLHFMTDVNLERAQHLMILAKILRTEKYYQTLGHFA
jgi:hypothetical protein